MTTHEMDQLHDAKKIAKEFTNQFVVYAMKKYQELSHELEPGNPTVNKSSFITGVLQVVGGGFAGACGILGGVGPSPAAGGAALAEKIASPILGRIHKGKWKTTICEIDEIIYSLDENERTTNFHHLVTPPGAELSYMFEAQFLTIADGTERIRSIKKVAWDAIDRAFTHWKHCSAEIETCDCFIYGVISGDSKPSTFKKFQIPYLGHYGRNITELKSNTKKLFESVGLFLHDSINADNNGLYCSVKKPMRYKKYGFRLASTFEKRNHNTFIANKFEKLPKPTKQPYEYKLKRNHIGEVVEAVLIAIKAKPIGHNSESPVPHSCSHFTTFPPGVRRPLLSTATRKKEVHELINHYNSGVRVILISGIGGQGKTELCRIFIRELNNSCACAPFIAWIDSSSGPTLFSSIKKIVERELTIKTEANDIQTLPQLISILGDIIRAKHSNAIFILDNANKCDELDKSLPALLEENFMVIVTTTCQNLFSGEVKKLKLGTLSKIDAEELVKFGLNAISQADLNMLLEAFGNHAFALRQATVFIKYRVTTDDTYTVVDYLNQFDAGHGDVIQQKLKLEGYDETIISVICTALDSGTNMNGSAGIIMRKLMDILSLVYPNGIFMDSLTKFHNHLNNNDNGTAANTQEVRMAIMQLKNCSLLEMKNGEASLNTITQKVIKLMLGLNWEGNVGKLLQMDLTEASVRDVTHLIRMWDHLSGNETMMQKHKRSAINLYSRMKKLGMGKELYVFKSTHPVFLMTGNAHHGTHGHGGKGTLKIPTDDTEQDDEDSAFVEEKDGVECSG